MLLLLLLHSAVLAASLASADAADDGDKTLTYLSVDDKAKRIHVNFITPDTNEETKYSTKLNNGGKTALSKDALFNYTLSDVEGSGAQNADDLALRSASILAPKTGKTLKYDIPNTTGDDGSVLMVELADGSSPSNLTVCVFGDYRADLYVSIALNLSAYIESNNCNLVLFIGKVVWEYRASGFAFNPHVMLHGGNREGRHLAFAKVPSIFGGVGSELSETTFFDSTEVNGVAFIQTTVTLVTVANLTYNTEQFTKVEEYFRETMLNELECKLQELYRRDKKPWIIVYLTHPSLYKEQTVNWLLLNSVDRFFEILKRYKIDLLTSCGIEGMTKILADRQISHPDEQLPAYIQTTLAECGGYMAYAPTVQNECSYTVLNIQKDIIFYQKRDMDSQPILNGTIDKNTQEPDKCVEHEL